MSDTPKQADDCQKLLDNGWTIVLYKNGLGSYTAAAVADSDKRGVWEAISDYNDIDRRLTDDFLPSQALYRLTEKLTTGRIA